MDNFKNMNTINVLNDIIRNTSMVIEGVVKGKAPKEKKIDMLIQRLQNTILDLLEIKKAIEHERE